MPRPRRQTDRFVQEGLPCFRIVSRATSLTGMDADREGPGRSRQNACLPLTTLCRSCPRDLARRAKAGAPSERLLVKVRNRKSFEKLVDHCQTRKPKASRSSRYVDWRWHGRAVANGTGLVISDGRSGVHEQIKLARRSGVARHHPWALVRPRVSYESPPCRRSGSRIGELPTTKTPRSSCDGCQHG